MLDLKFIRENKDAVSKALSDKRVDLDLDKLLEIDREVVSLKGQLQELQTQRNSNSKQIPSASAADKPALIAKGKEIGEAIKEMNPRLQQMEEQLQQLLWQVPNIPDPQAPKGASEEDNVEVKKHGDLPQFSFTPWDHVELLEKQEWADFQRIGQVCGSRSYSLRNEMVLLEMAIHRLALDILREKGFTLAQVPAFARKEALIGTGHFPTGEDQVYFLPEDNLYLSGTAEVQLNSLHSGEILSEKDLPILYAGYSPCFRREAGSYGRDVRGLIRVHQFTKVEQYIICQADSKEAEDWHKKLLQTSEEIVKALELPYRIVECCTGDMGAGKVRMYDVECWVPSEQKYRETHSCSNLGDWQARRTDLRYRDTSGQVKHCFTLNNTAAATPRLLVPFLENHQQADGRIRMPKALQKYFGPEELIGKIVR